MKKIVLYLTMAITCSAHQAFSFDHSHKIWNNLLSKHVVMSKDLRSSRVNYSNLKTDGSQLDNYLKMLSFVKKDTFETWSKDKQLAFLINAYNAFTVKLIIKNYPDIASIRDIKTGFFGPWKIRFVELFGDKIHLDAIENKMIRKKGVYDDPFIHAALVCAAIGCPPLRNEAYTYDRLNQQLEDNMERFLSDKKQNRFNHDTGTLDVSSIFKWYREDFEKGYRNFTSLEGFFVQYADRLAQQPEDVEKIKSTNVDIRFLDYDWFLNDNKILN
jgi:hypothetical protein